MQAWPADLPQQPRAEADVQQSTGLLDPDARIYPVRTRTYPEHSATFVFPQITAAQFQAFRSWWDGTLNQCAPFSAPWLVLLGLDHHFCRFDPDGPWSVALSGALLDLTINVEIIADVPTADGSPAYYLPLGDA